ncbi:MAG: hypothetical protein ACYC6Y_32105 [Thermoguttaceae bacterium]
MRRGRVLLGVMALGCVFFWGPGQAGAALEPVTLHFSHIPEAGDGATEIADGEIGETQLFVEVFKTPVTGGVSFKFTNVGPGACSITDIYFDGATLLDSMMPIEDSGDGVAFSQYAKPAELSAGESLQFVTTAELSADSDSPIVPQGVNNYNPALVPAALQEWVTISFALQSGVSYDSVIEALTPAVAGAIPDLRIGLHVQGFASGGSQTFINDPPLTPPIDDPPAVPEPASLLVWSLMGAGLVGGAAARKRRQTGWSDRNRRAICDLIDQGRQA